jgi:tryptophan-rich sensory protein
MSLSTTVSTAPSFKWWYAVLIFLLVNAVNSVATLSLQGDFEFYNSLVQPSIAPPDWLFPIAWLFNNICALVALYRVANSDLPKANKVTFYWAEGCFWVLFSLFGFMYFYLGSVWLAAFNTICSYVATIVSISAIIRHGRNWLLLLPRFLWLSLATGVSIYMALNNPDPFF